LLKLSNLDEKINVLAKIWGEINAIHPCREGNGRTTRLFLSELALFNGIQLQWELLTKEENLEGSKKSLRCDYSINIKLLHKIMKH
jgi:cell filamentation protein